MPIDFNTDWLQSWHLLECIVAEFPFFKTRFTFAAAVPIYATQCVSAWGDSLHPTLWSVSKTDVGLNGYLDIPTT